MFSTTAKYALRALVHLAELPPGESILGRDLSALSGVPANYLSKILLTLKRAGLVEATRGLGGGYRLLKPAGEVRLKEVFDLFDPLDTRSTCFLGDGRVCSEETPCPAHERWSHLREAYLDFTVGTALTEISISAAQREPVLV